MRTYIKDKDGLVEPIGFSDHFAIIGSLGVANLRVKNSVIGVTYDETDRLLQTNKNHWESLGAQVGLGYVHYFRGNTGYLGQAQWFPFIQPQVNVHFINGNPGIKGNVQLFESQDSNQLFFNAPVYSTRLMFDTALTVVARSPFSLYAIGGIGNAWNRMKYSDKTIGYEVNCNESISLRSHTHANFAWEVGGGLMANISNRIALNFQYLYADLGKARSSVIVNDSANHAPLYLPPIFNLSAQTLTLGLHIAI